MSNTMQWPSPGLGHAPSYQVSGIPFATGSFTVSNTVKRITFPYVTSWISITHNSDNDLRVGFSENGINGNNFFIIPGSSTTSTIMPPVHVKCSDIYLLRDNAADITKVTVFAGLTSIPTGELAGVGPSGINWSGSSGVG